MELNAQCRKLYALAAWTLLEVVSWVGRLQEGVVGLFLGILL